MSFDSKLHQNLIADFEAYLEDLQKDRKTRPEIKEFNGEPLPEWAIYEIESMFDRVNQIRRDLGLDTCPIKDVLTADHMAAGHSDYSHKFALYCAEIAQDKFSH